MLQILKTVYDSYQLTKVNILLIQFSSFNYINFSIFVQNKIQESWLDTYKVKQNFLGLMYAYLIPVLFLFVIGTFMMQYIETHSTIAIVYILVFIPLIVFRYMKYIKRPMEIEVSGNQIKMKDIFGKVTECTFSDITDIEVNKRRELFITINDNKLCGLNTFKGFDKFLEDAKEKNPKLKLWGFDKQ